MIVADTNLVIPLLTRGPEYPIAVSLLARTREWHLPLFWRVELQNVLASYVRFLKMPLAEATELLTAAGKLPHLKEYDSKSQDCLRIAASLNISAYDAQFLELAKRLGMPLLTFDRQLRQAAPDLCADPASLV